MGKLRSIIYGLVALMVFFTITATVLMDQFKTTYEHGFGSTPCSETSCTSASDTITNAYCIGKGSAIACSNCNTSTGYETFLSSCHSLIEWKNGTHCYACTDWGFKTSARGLNLLVLVIGLVFIAVMFLMYIKKKY